MTGYINWREEAGLPGTKPRKVPFDPARGVSINPHDRTQWRSYDECVATGYPVGMVLAADDPYFLLDLDDALDTHTGQWSQWAVDICARFPGAFIEISVSGTGLHVMGRCDPLRLGPRRHKWADGHLEWYFEGRFVALGRDGRGDIELDWTDVLAGLVPVRDVPDAAVLSDVDDPAYTLGALSDDEILHMALNSRGSAAGLMGDRATFRQLFEADVAALSRFFPSATAGAPYDASAADVALVSQLAFWCGKNAARIDRLFRRSGLMRDKWSDRQDYRASTMQRGVTGVSRVYDRPRDDAPTVHFGDYLTIEDQLKHFDGCVYISEEHAVLVPSGEIMKPDRFKSWYGGYEFKMSHDGSKPTRNAFEAFTENRAHKFPKVLYRAFQPRQPFGAILDDGASVNTYRDPCVETSDGDPGPFLDLMARLIPDERDRAICLAWMAALVQYPGQKFQWAPVLQGTKGNGKSFIGQALSYCVGRQYAHSPKPDKLAGQFNGFLLDKLLIVVEEMHMFARRETLEKLKDYITGAWQEVERKGVDSRMVESFANWIFFTNHKDAVIVERDDRRFAVIFTAQQDEDDVTKCGMGGEYFPRLWDWARAGGFACIRGYLARHPIPEALNPATLAQRAPKTTSRDEAIESSFGVVEQIILDAIEAERQGFRGGWISTWAATALLDERRVKNGPRTIAKALENLGYFSTIRASAPILHEGNTKPKLYRVSGTGAGTLDQYLAAQGYRSMPAPRMVA